MLRISELRTCDLCRYSVYRSGVTGTGYSCTFGDASAKQLFKKKKLKAARICRYFRVRASDDEDTEESSGLDAKTTEQSESISGRVESTDASGDKEKDKDKGILKGEQIAIEDALDFLMQDWVQVVLHSTKNHKDYCYRLQVPSNCRGAQNDGVKLGIRRFVNYYTEDGKWNFLGTIYYTEEKNEFRFKSGNTGDGDPSSIEVKSILFVLNKLVKKEYDLKLEVYKGK